MHVEGGKIAWYTLLTSLNYFMTLEKPHYTVTLSVRHLQYQTCNSPQFPMYSAWIGYMQQFDYVPIASCFKQCCACSGIPTVYRLTFWERSQLMEGTEKRVLDNLGKGIKHSFFEGQGNCLVLRHDSVGLVVSKSLSFLCNEFFIARSMYYIVPMNVHIRNLY